MKRIVTAVALAAAAIGGLSGAASAAGEVNLYSTREPDLINPALAAFTKATGIKANIVYVEKGLIERLKAEGANSPADAVLIVDIGVLHDLDQAGVLQPSTSAVAKKNIPANLSHPQDMWHALTTRARVLYTSKARVQPGFISTYEDLARPDLKGKVCIRSGKHEYNISLFASMIAHKGYDEAKKWLDGLKKNLAQKAGGNDRAQAKGIAEGVCDVGITNTYYYGLMSTNDKEPEQKTWAAAVNIVFPNQGDRGTHVNVSGIGVTKSSKNKENAMKLLEYLSDNQAQEIYAKLNYEFPVKPGVKTDPLIDGLGKFKVDAINLLEIAKQRGAASRMVDEVGFDQFDPRS